MDLIDARRLGRILVEALEEETMLVIAVPVLPGSFAGSGNAFDISSANGGNHHGDRNEKGPYDNC